jgi:hypothetical protein
MGRSYRQGGGQQTFTGGEILETFNAPTLNVSVNDYALQQDGFLTCTILALNASAAINITGLQGAFNNRKLIVQNVGENTITLKANSGLSQPGHLFNFGADVALDQWQALEICGNTAASGWVQIGVGGGGGGAPTTETYVTDTDETAELPNSVLWAYDFTPDTHTSVPSNVANDEFDFGAALDTAGARFVDAIPWTIYNPETTTNVVANGALQYAGQTGSLNIVTVYGQPITEPADPFTFLCKRLPTLSLNIFDGLFVGFEATGKGYYFGTNSTNLYVITQSAYGGSGATAVYTANISSANFNTWLQLGWDGTDFNFSFSFDGTQYETVYSALLATFLVDTPDTIGLFYAGDATAALTNQGAFDYFRRTL